MAFFFCGATTMHASPFEADAAARSADQRPEESREDDRGVMRASPDRNDDDAQSDDAIDEPGYGHGV
jgi:hypothetical protein